MERFVRLEVFDSDGAKVWRTFNMRYIRHFDEDTCRMMLNGARTAILVDRASMPVLVQAATVDIEGMSERILYLQGRHDAAFRDMFVKKKPWWKRIFRRGNV